MLFFFFFWSEHFILKRQTTASVIEVELLVVESPKFSRGTAVGEKLLVLVRRFIK